MSDDKKCDLGDRVFPLGSGLFTHHHPDTCEPTLMTGRPMEPGETPRPGEKRYRRQEDGSFTPVAEGSGPAKVTSEAYRVGYARIFGGKQEVGQA